MYSQAAHLYGSGICAQHEEQARTSHSSHASPVRAARGTVLSTKRQAHDVRQGLS